MLPTGRDYFFAYMGILLAAGVALFQGSIQTLSRSLYARLIPAGIQAAEFLGFYNMIGKFAAIIGPALLGLVTMLTGNIRYGIATILFLFLAGGWLLSRERIAGAYRSTI